MRAGERHGVPGGAGRAAAPVLRPLLPLQAPVARVPADGPRADALLARGAAQRQPRRLVGVQVPGRAAVHVGLPPRPRGLVRPPPIAYSTAYCPQYACVIAYALVLSVLVAGATAGRRRSRSQGTSGGSSRTSRRSRRTIAATTTRCRPSAAARPTVCPASSRPGRTTMTRRLRGDAECPARCPLSLFKVLLALISSLISSHLIHCMLMPVSVVHVKYCTCTCIHVSSMCCLLGPKLEAARYSNLCSAGGEYALWNYEYTYHRKYKYNSTL